MGIDTARRDDSVSQLMVQVTPATLMGSMEMEAVSLWQIVLSAMLKLGCRTSTEEEMLVHPLLLVTHKVKLPL